nr:putative ribonuclease H-like domain-containing protein [Tanacetum cinerariifolium]
MTHPHLKRNVVPTAVLTRSRLMSLNATRPVTTTDTQSTVKCTRTVKNVLNKAHSPVKRPINQRTTTKYSNFNKKVTTVKVNKVNVVQGNKGNAKKASACWVWKPKCNPQQALQDKGVIDSGCSRHMTGNISFIFEFKEINRGYVAFGGDPNGGNQPNDNAGIKENLDADPKNTYDDVANDAFEVKENENDVHVFANESNKTDKKKHDEKAKRDDKGNSPVDSLKRVRDLRVEFEEFSFNSTNYVNAVSELVNADGPNLTNSTNSFNTASPFVNVVSLNFRIARKSSFVDPFKYTDDPNMPELEDIVYSDDKEDAGAEADLFNLETNIPVSPIPTTRVHKDHPVNQIIGDLNSAPQTRSMTRMVKEQEEGIDYDEVFTPVARIEAIRLFLAYASFMGFMVYQMDDKSAFLYGTIKEDVYVCQPLGFEDPDYPDKVYKVVKAFYGLHQAPRAWYETFANYLLENGLQRGNIDQTLFINKQKGDILLVQVYVDAIIFGSTNKELCTTFEKLMKDKFQISSMRELTFFLGLQVKKKKDGIFISQDKYVVKILRKFGFTNVKSASTPIETEEPLLKDPDGEDMDVHL